MKRDDITRLFPEATAEQINALLNINSADIGKARSNADQLQKDLDAARDTIATLEKSRGDAERLQAEVDRYRQAESDRAAAEQQAAEQAQLEQRFNAVTGERRYTSDYVRRGLMEDFGKALKDEVNVGKSDADVFAALTRDQSYFASMNPPAGNMPPFNPDVDGDGLDALSDAEYYARVMNKKKE